eukprot:tig00020830_g14478.t1
MRLLAGQTFLRVRLHGLCAVLAAGRALARRLTPVSPSSAAADALADAVAPPAGEYAAGEGEWWTGGAAARRAHDERLAMARPAPLPRRRSGARLTRPRPAGRVERGQGDADAREATPRPARRRRLRGEDDRVRGLASERRARGPRRLPPCRPEGAAANGAPEAGTAASVGAGLLAAYDAQILKDLELWRAEAYDGFPMHLARDIAGLASSIKAAGDGAGPEHRDPHEFLRDYLRYVLQPAAELAAIHRIAEALAGHNSADPNTEDARGARGAVLEAMEALADAVDPPAHVPRSDQRRMDERLLDAVDEAIEEAKDGVGPAMDAAMAELAAAAEARAEAALGRELAPGERPGMLLAAIAFDNPVSPVHRIVLTNEGGEEADAATRLEELRNKIPLVLQAAEGDEDSALRLMLFLAVHRLPEGAFGAVGPGWSREASFWTNASGKAGEMETKESLEGAAVALGADEVGEDELLGGLEPSGEDQLGGGGLEGTPLTGSGMPLGLL